MKKEDKMDRVLDELEAASMELKSSLDSIDRMVADAVDSGVESGRMLGLVQAYDFLVKSGFVQSSKALRIHIDEVLLGLSTPKS